MSTLDGKIMDIFQSLFGWIWTVLFGPFKDLKGFKDLIYGTNTNGTHLAFGIFTDSDINNIYTPGKEAFLAVAISAILIGIVIAGMKVSSTGINPSNRTYVIEFFKDLIIVGILIFNLDTLYQVIFAVNYSIVDAFSSGVTKELITMNDTIDTSKGVLGNLIINLALLGLSIWANFYYMMRRLTLLLLMILGPLMAAFYLIPQTKGITAGWLKELVGTVMVQSVHAALYWMVALMSISTNGIEGILLYIIFIPVSESIRSLLGLGGQMNDRLSRSATMFGGAALAGMYGSVKGAIGGKSVTEALRKATGSAIQAVKGKNGEGEAEGTRKAVPNATDTGSTSRAERMLKAGEILSKGGKAVFGAAGAVVGAPMGPMASIAASSIGFSTGGTVGGLAGRAGMAIGEGAVRRLGAGGKAAYNKFKGIKNGEKNADEKVAQAIADDETTKWADANKQGFMKDLKERFPDATDASLDKMWNDKVSTKRGEFLDKARSTVGQLKKNTRNHAKASDLVDSTVDKLTNDWEKNNKTQFMQKYDAQNPLPANASEGDIKRHNQNKETAWQNSLSNKKQAIKDVVTKGAVKLSNQVPTDISYISKDEFANEVGKEIGSIIGVSNREAVMSVKGATSSLKPVSLYSGKSVNREYLANQLAGVRTEAGKQDYINQAIKQEGKSEQTAIQEWNNVEAPRRFQNNLSDISKTLPRNIPLDHTVIGNKAGRGIAAVTGAVWSGAVGASGVKEISQFMADTKAGQALIGIQQGFSNAPKFDMSQGVIHGTTSGIIGVAKSIGSTAASNFTNHVPSNVIEKQAGYKNAVAYTTGIVGGVTGYKAGASFAAGAPTNFTKEPGAMSFGFNPYNNAVNKQIKEVSDIAHMAQTIKTPNGEVIASGAIRMVTTDTQTVIQVRDKTGNVQTVSRIASGDSSLKKGQTIYQDLTIQSGQLAHSSNVYQEDSGGGKIAVNRSINVNPNKIVANRNTHKNPRVVQEVQSYNQNVDSGQYYMKDAMTEMSNIHMVVERGRSYMVGTKGEQEYRISQYGPGDARLEPEEVVYRKCEVQNRKLVTTTSHKNSLTAEGFEYTNSTQPDDLSPEKLMPKFAPNKRNANRQQLEKFRNKSFVESLR